VIRQVIDRIVKKRGEFWWIVSSISPEFSSIVIRATRQFIQCDVAVMLARRLKAPIHVAFSFPRPISAHFPARRQSGGRTFGRGEAFRGAGAQRSSKRIGAE
jgi:hypothetical protein